MEEAPREIVDLARMRAVYERDRENLRAAADPEAPSVTRVVVRVLEDVHLEARAGRFVLYSDEPPERGGGASAPTPLMYFAVGVGT
jgi:hypothetical protein